MEEFLQVDKRNFKRIPFKEPVKVQTKDLSVTIGSLSRNISEKGIQVRVNDFIPVNTELFLQIKFKNEEIIDSYGRIVWIEKIAHSEYYLAGMELIENKSIYNSQNRIRQMIEL